MNQDLFDVPITDRVQSLLFHLRMNLIEEVCYLLNSFTARQISEIQIFIDLECPDLLQRFNSCLNNEVANSNVMLIDLTESDNETIDISEESIDEASESSLNYIDLDDQDAINEVYRDFLDENDEEMEEIELNPYDMSVEHNLTFEEIYQAFIDDEQLEIEASESQLTFEELLEALNDDDNNDDLI